MKLHFECAMGCSGDMMMAALYELLPDKEAFREKMRRLSIPGVELNYSASEKCGITGTHITVTVGGIEEKSEDVNFETGNIGSLTEANPGAHASVIRTSEIQTNARRSIVNVSAVLRSVDKFTNAHNHSEDKENKHKHKNVHTHDHTHRHGSGQDHDHVHSHGSGQDHDHTHSHDHNSYNGIVSLIQGLELPENVLNDALGVYRILGEAEAAVHGKALEDIHLHEVGRFDAVADIVGCCLLINMLGVSIVTASPIHVGSGAVRCEHGILPVPAPAAAEILRGIPIYGGSIKGELCTPTGAALLKRFVSNFGPMPTLKIVRIGCGMGKKDFEAANCVRAFLGEEDENDGGGQETIYEISCNLDDMTPEAIGAAFDMLFQKGALDVYTTPIMMKKNRPAAMLTCLCAEESRDNLSRLMLQHTSTLGVRITSHHREVLKRSEQTVTTKYGTIRIKHAQGFGTIKLKPEYDDVVAAAQKHGVSFSAVYDAAVVASRETGACQ